MVWDALGWCWDVAGRVLYGGFVIGDCWGRFWDSFGWFGDCLGLFGMVLGWFGDRYFKGWGRGWGPARNGARPSPNHPKTSQTIPNHTKQHTL